MSEILNKQICLALNRNWMSLDFRTIRKAVEDITSINPHTGKPPFMFLDLVYEQMVDGSYNTDSLISARPVSVDEWMNLAVRSCDLVINCGCRQLRAPTIIVASSYSDIPMKRPKFSTQAIWERDNYTCQVTGERVTRETGDLGHNVAKANGGRKSWENIALIRKDLNRQQGTRTFADMGWTHVKPKAPRAARVILTIDDMKHDSQKHFLEKN